MATFKASAQSIINNTQEWRFPDVGPQLAQAVGTNYYVLLPYLTALALITWSTIYAVRVTKSYRGPDVSMYPVMNKTKEEYFKTAPALLARGSKETPGKPFRVDTGMGSVIILPPNMAHEIRNDRRFDASTFLLQYWQAGIPGFEPYICLGSDLMHDVIKQFLTKNEHMAKLNPASSAEARQTIEEVLTGNEEWHEIHLYPNVLNMVARISSLTFLGDELCHNPKWMDITVNYTRKATMAARDLRQWPWATHKIVHWFLPQCRSLRAMVAEARRECDTILRKRRQQKAAGKGQVVFNDTLEWYEQVAEKKGIKYDAATQQLGLSIGAILTSSDLITQALVDICRKPDLWEPLREEIREVLKDGWKSNSIQKLKLLDSVLKEVLRLKPVASSAAMGRRVLEDVHLSDGSFLPKNCGIVVSAERMRSPEVYGDPNKFDGYRFLRLREAAMARGDEKAEAAAQLCSTTPEHFGFGYGLHSCPGRFFGANTSKLVMCHLIMKYDWDLIETSNPDPLGFGFSLLASPTARVMIRKRKEHVHF